jgi:hypothetical protein
MKAKLIKVENTFYLKQGETILATSSIPNLSASIRYSLSKQNCDEIFGVVDVDKLAEEETIRNEFNSEKSFINGFNKAMELNKDKLFTLEDMMNCWNKALTFQNHKELFGYHIQSLQQNEWGVEIVMEDIIHLKNRRGGLANMGKPKLDADSCLILKRR